MTTSGRKALGWLVVLLVCILGVAGMIAALAIVINHDGAFQYVGGGVIVAVTLLIAKLGLSLKDRIERA